MQSETKNCQNCKKDFIIDIDEFSLYEKMQVPTPKICPECRFKMRAMWRNETSLYNRKCAKTSTPIISVYNPKLPYLVVSHEYYESDSWDAKEYGMDFDFEKPFFDQLNELLLKVPKAPTFLSTGDGPNINSNYSNYAGGLKNCYFVFNSGPAEETMYSRGHRKAYNVVDGYFGTEVENMYECVNSQKSSNIYFGKDVVSSIDCMFVTNLNNCNKCFCCVNLRNASYHIFNQPVSKEEYETRINEVLGSYERIERTKKEFSHFEKKFPVKETHNLRSVNSTGDYLTECKNVRNSFEVVKGENSYYLFSSKEIKDSIGTIGYGFRSERLLECVSTGYSSNIIAGSVITNCRDVMYSYFLRNCHNCIGCDSLKNSEYCILNKQYSKEEYAKIKNHIIQELKSKDLFGLIMPPELSPFAYNETIAQDNFTLTKEEALVQGFRWEEDIQKTEKRETTPPDKIPDHIKNIPDSIAKEILRCIDCNRNYKITEQELQFYKKMVLPIPRKCFFCRHKDRVLRRGPYKFWERECAKCQKEITTNYAPDQSEIVYCEKCYQQEVY